jgi:hypothetical protein
MEADQLVSRIQHYDNEMFSIFLSDMLDQDIASVIRAQYAGHIFWALFLD